MRHYIAIYSGLLLLLLTLGLLHYKAGITGYATADPATIKEQVKDFASKLAPAQLVDNGNGCIIIPINGAELSYDLAKSGATVNIIENCNANLSSYDIVIRFLSYDAFLKSYQDPAGDFAKRHAVDYYFLPSKAIQTGGAFNCNDEFKNKYCAVPYLYFSQTELETVNSCCANYALTATQKARVEQLKPRGFFEANALILSVLFAVILAIVIFSLVLTKKMKKKSKETEKVDELKNYVSGMLARGYTPIDIKKSLANAGWTLQQIEEAFK